MRGNTLICPLCESENTPWWHTDRKRHYHRCLNCSLVFVPPKYYLSAKAEKAHYDLHNNDPRDARYRTFLSRLANPLIAQLPAAATGLDFGSGPGPTLSMMMTEAGFPTEIYDPIYAPDIQVWEQKYDFVTASEVAEHLHRPQFEFRRIWASLRPRGVLAIMTKRVRDRAAFASWHYKNDPTHVIFFSEQTFHWLSQDCGAELQIVASDVVFLWKSKD